MTHKFPIAEIS